MAQRITTEITKFGGMIPDVRNSDKSNCAFCVHFDLFRNRTLAPNRSYTAITDGGEKITRFLYAKQGSETNYAIYGMGDAVGIAGGLSGKPGVYYKTPTATAWTDGVALIDGALAANVFALYKDSLYGWQNGNELWRVFNLASSLSSTNALLTQTYTNVAQPVHHKADDYLYIFHDNIVRRLTDATTVSSVLLTLPDNMKIMGGANYGNYLIIAASPIKQGTANSVLYVWDRDSSLATVSAKIDLGPGTITAVSESNEGGVWIVQENSSVLVGFGAYNNEIQIKYFNGTLETLVIPNGSENEYFSQIRTYDGDYLPMATATEVGGSFHFAAEVKTRLAAETKNVIFAVRRTASGLELIADQEITEVGGAGTNYIRGIFEIGNHWLISYQNAGVTLTEQTVTGSTYQTAVYESVVFSLGDASVTKKLVSATIFTSPLPAAGTTVLKYRIDAETSWTTIFTHSTDDSLSHTAINIESSGANLPHFKEIQFRIESTGGSEITGFKFKADPIDKDIA